MLGCRTVRWREEENGREWWRATETDREIWRGVMDRGERQRVAKSDRMQWGVMESYGE